MVQPSCWAYTFVCQSYQTTGKKTLPKRKSGGYHLGMKEENKNVLSTWPQEFLNLNSCCFPHEKRIDHYSLDPSYKQSTGKGFILLSWIQLALASVIVI